MMRASRPPVLPLLLFVAASFTTQAILAAAVEERDSQPAPLDCVINPSVVADLGSGVPGILSEVRVDRSDFVDAGEVVAQLDSGVEVAARDLAKVRAEKDTEIKLRRVNAAFGRRQHKRTEDLFQRKVVSTNDMDERKTEAELAGIQLRQALDNKEIATLELSRAEEVLKRRTIKSPISGVVMERFKTIGEYVDEQPVLRVAQLDPLHVEVFVPVEKLGDIRPGMQAEVWSDAVDGRTWNAEVTRVDRVADVASGTYGVRLELPNPDYKVPAGLRCQLAFTSQPGSAVAEQPAPVGTERPIAVATGSKKRPAPAERPSDAVTAAVATEVRREMPAHVTVQAAAKVTHEVAIAQPADNAAANADANERSLPMRTKETAGTSVDEPPSGVSSGEASVIAAEPDEPVLPSLGGLPKKQTAEEPATKGVFDRIVALVTDRPEANTDGQPVDADGRRQPADDASGTPERQVNERPREEKTADALAGGLDGVAPFSRNTRRAEINTRAALTGRIDLEFPPDVTDEAAPVCVSAGPFDNESVATAQARRLRDAGLSATVENRKTTVGIGYRVVSTPLATLSDATAVIDRLKQAGLKDYYLAGSNPPFHLMLGTFSSASGATRRIKQLAGLDIEAEKRPWKRDVAVYTLLVFGTPTAAAAAQLAQLPVPPDDATPAHCEQFAAR